MPYKFESKKYRTPKSLDRRIKLTDDQRDTIYLEHSYGATITSLAIRYKVSKRLITFIVYPEKYERCKEQRRKRKYNYSRDYINEKMKEHRHYKKELYEAHLLEGQDEKDSPKS